LLPYNNAAAQTTGFTIPQAIVDNGIVEAYIRYFTSGPNDTATDASLGQWSQIPYSTEFAINDPVNGVQGTFPLDVTTSIDDGGFYIRLQPQVYATGQYFVTSNIPAVIRIVEIPAGQINTIESIHKEMTKKF